MRKVVAVLVFACFSFSCGGISIPARDPGTGSDQGAVDPGTGDASETGGNDVAEGPRDPGGEPVSCKKDEDCTALVTENECLRPACDLKTETCTVLNQPVHVPCTPEDFTLPTCHVGECDGKGTCIEALAPDGTNCEPVARSGCELYQCKAGNCVNAGSGCDDGDACTEDACIADACKHTPVSCDDKNPCTDDACDKLKGCVHATNAATCEDGNACTVGDLCQVGLCIGGGVKDCDDGNPCTSDSCDKVKGCVYTPNTMPCSDGDACTMNDSCKDGLCKGGQTLDCDDKNPCTTDACDKEKGCIHELNTAPCSDGNACTQNDSCFGGVCIPGPTLDCDDANPCTADSCTPALGCGHDALAIPCDDGNACTQGDTCEEGKCVPGPAMDCDDHNPCTKESCEPTSGCQVQFQPEGMACDDGNGCTKDDQCIAGMCKGNGLDCNDNNPCTDDRCDDPVKGCYHVDNSATCDDGNLCTLQDSCLTGKCQGVGTPNCDDGNPCTDDACDPETGCVHKENAVLCDDGNACTVGDRCLAGVCKGGGAMDCTDGNPCTDDSCDPVKGCVNTANSAACDDGNPCTAKDICSGGACKGTTPVNCDDGNPCTTDTCDKTNGCQYVNNTASCDDKNACTTKDTCVGGKCVGGPAPDCDDKKVCTTDTCIPAQGCVHTNNTNSCDDKNLCTSGDACKDGTCVGAIQVVCNDNNPCTTDSCDAATGCVYKAVQDGTACDDGNTCTTGDKCTGGKCSGTGTSCDDGNPCTDDTCDSSGMDGDVCVYTNNTAACDDGSVCTTGDKCTNGKCVGTAQIVCNDGNVCTTDSCDPKTGCVYTNNTASCDDLNKCTSSDKCSGGKCVGGASVVCDDKNVCTTDSCDPVQGCVYTANTMPCDDGNECTSGDTCSNKTCAGVTVSCDDKNICTDDKCDPAIGCMHTNNKALCAPAACDGLVYSPPAYCANGGCLESKGTNCDDGNACTDDTCSTKTGCGHTNNTASCSDGNSCTYGDACSDGSCKGTAYACKEPNPHCKGDKSCGCFAGKSWITCDAGSATMCSSTTSPFGYPMPVCMCGKYPACVEPNPDCLDGICKCCNALGNCFSCDTTTSDTCGKSQCQCGANPACKIGYQCVSGTCKQIANPRY